MCQIHYFYGGIGLSVTDTTSRDKLALREKLVWGWLRLFLGITQMMLVALSLGLLLTTGLKPTTYAVIAGATLATVISRLLYRGRKRPH
jgi:hypothetical protein